MASSLASSATPAFSVAPTPLRRYTLVRRLSYIMLLRVVLYTLILGGTVSMYFAWGTPEELGNPYVTLLFVVIAALYLLNITYALLMRWVADLARLTRIQIVGDLLVSALLVHFTGGAESAFVLFFLLNPIAAAVLLSRRAALITALAGALMLALVVLAGYHHLLPALPGQVQLPWEVSAGSLGRSLLINSLAMFAIAALSGNLAAQLQLASQHVEVQQEHIDDLAALNADIIRCLTSGLLTVNNEGVLLTMNQAAGEILRLQPAAASGQALGDLSAELADTARQAPAERVELVLERGGGSQLLEVSVSRLTDHRGATVGQIINFQDLTSLRRMEQEMKRAEHLTSLGRMAAGIAHEIRNPLASISGSLELLGSAAELQEEDRRLMGIALTEIERLDGLITDFLAFARPRPPRLEPLDLGQEIEHLAGAIGGLLDEQDRPRLEILSQGAGLWVQADRDQLSGVLWNLVRNAWEADASGRVLVQVQAQGEQTVSLRVNDNGYGISAADQAHIFDPFFTTKDHGTGLGLAMVHRIVEDHGGEIDVESEPGKGTTFSIKLPRCAPAEA